MEDKAFIHLKKCDHTILAKADTIDRIRWADTMSARELMTLARYMDVYEAEVGATILEEGGTDAHMLLVVSGRVEVIKSGTTGEMKTIATIAPGQSFGEMSLIDGRPRSASAVAATPVSLLVLSKEDFTRLSEEEPKLGITLLYKLTGLTSQHLRQTTEKILEQL